jgi:predicted nucleic acid-binding Zn ribbon protein
VPGELSPAERARLAAQALEQARSDARARGEGLPARRAGAGGRQYPGGQRHRAGDTAHGDAPEGAGATGRGAPQAAGGDGNAPGMPREACPPGPARANQAAAGSGGPAGTGGPASTGPARAAGAGATGRSRRTRREDPEPLRSALGKLLDEQGWREELAVGGVFGRWPEIVGPELAAHARPDGFSGGELLVTADSTAWAAQLRLLAGTLTARINAELGATVVRRVRVRGPAPPPRAGAWRVRGGRGPGGDYG